MSARQPLPRFSHGAVGIENTLYVWGGHSTSAKIRTSILESFDVPFGTWEYPHELRGALPDGLNRAAVATDGDCAYSFGGQKGHFPCSTFNNTLYQINPITLQCKRLVPTNPSDAPKEANGSRMVYFKDTLVVHGGWDGENSTDEVHVFDLKKSVWSAQPTTGERPPPLSDHTFTKIDHHKAVVVGGNKNTDVHVLDMETWHWIKLEVSRATPCRRTCHATCCIAGPLTGQQSTLLMLVGGTSNGLDILRDMWLLDLDKGEWMEVNVDLTARAFHSAVTFGTGPSFRVVVLFGGRSSMYDNCEVPGTTLLLFELRGGMWELTRVVSSHALAGPDEKLKEQMKTLEISSQEETGDGGHSQHTATDSAASPTADKNSS